MSILDAIDLPIRTTHTLYKIAWEKSKTDDGKTSIDEVIDVIEEGG